MITLYHAGVEVIEKPDIHHGRKNADFGQGFYTIDNRDFACRWVTEKSGCDVIINKYEIDESSLKIKELKRDESWFEYIFSNRRVRPDVYSEYDLITGPISNDTIFDSFGIITSGFLNSKEAMKLMMIGLCFRQVVLKSQRAADNLKFLSSEVLSKDMIKASREAYIKENEEYQSEFAKAMQKLHF